MKNFKKILCIMLALILTASFFGCKKEEEAPAVSAYDLQKAMLDADESLPEMTSVNSSAENAEELFAYLSKLEYSKVQGFFLAYSTWGLADEIAVIILKNQADSAQAVETLKKHVEGRVNLYQSYKPDQATRAEKALVFSRGKYAVLIISDNSEKVKAAFEEAIK